MDEKIGMCCARMGSQNKYADISRHRLDKAFAEKRGWEGLTRSTA